MKYIPINVLQMDIDHGIPQNADACPIARAATRAFGRKCQVSDVIKVEGNGELSLPAVASQFITALDQCGKKSVTPLTFMVAIEEREAAGIGLGT